MSQDHFSLITGGIKIFQWTQFVWTVDTLVYICLLGGICIHDKEEISAVQLLKESIICPGGKGRCPLTIIISSFLVTYKMHIIFLQLNHDYAIVSAGLNEIDHWWINFIIILLFYYFFKIYFQSHY